MSALTPDPWQVITDLASVLYRGGQDAGDVRREALGVLERNGISSGKALPVTPEPQSAPAKAWAEQPAMTPAVARPELSSVLVLAVGENVPDSSVEALEKALAAATAGEGVTVVTVRGVEALRTWHPAVAPGSAGRPTTGLEDAMLRNVDGLNDLIRDMLQAFPDTADEPEWRDRAGALNVHDPDGQPYRALTEEDM